MENIGIYCKSYYSRVSEKNTDFHVCVVAGRCQAEPDSVQQLHVQRPSTYAKPEATSAVLGSS
jgi:hypothetical protein